jgi:hypothetical protein
MATARGSLNFDINVRGVREIERALDALPADALVRFKAATKRIANDVADRIRAAGRADSRQSARAAQTVRVTTNRNGATIKAGPHPLLLGSEFGAIRRFGFYSDERFDHSMGRQFRPWVGRGSYWFFRSALAEQPRVEQEFGETVDEIVNHFRAG